MVTVRVLGSLMSLFLASHETFLLLMSLLNLHEIERLRERKREHYRTVRLQDCKNTGLWYCGTVRLQDSKTVGLQDCKTVGL